MLIHSERLPDYPMKLALAALCVFSFSLLSLPAFAEETETVSGALLCAMKTGRLAGSMGRRNHLDKKAVVELWRDLSRHCQLSAGLAIQEGSVTAEQLGDKMAQAALLAMSAEGY